MKSCNHGDVSDFAERVEVYWSQDYINGTNPIHKNISWCEDARISIVRLSKERDKTLAHCEPDLLGVVISTPCAALFNGSSSACSCAALRFTKRQLGSQSVLNLEEFQTNVTFLYSTYVSNIAMLK
jgi:hypothetical protein